VAAERPGDAAAPASRALTVAAILYHSEPAGCDRVPSAVAGGSELLLLENARATYFSRRANLLVSLAVIAALCGCAMSRQDHLVEARAALADAAYDEAIAAAEAGLRAAAGGSQEMLDDATSWGLELAKLEAHARAGHGDEAKAQLTELANRYPNRIEASEYFATAHQLRGAGAGIAFWMKATAITAAAVQTVVARAPHRVLFFQNSAATSSGTSEA